MTSIVGSFSASGSVMAGSAPSVTSMQNQITILQRQSADCAGCATTSASEKQKQVNALNQQIQALQTKIDKVQQFSSPSRVITPPNPTANINDQRISHNGTGIVEGVNRPEAGAVSGSVINISV